VFYFKATPQHLHGGRQLQWVGSDYGIRPSVQKQALKSNTQDTIRRIRNKRQTLRNHSSSPDTQTEEAECYSPRPNLKTNAQGTTLCTRSRGTPLVEALRNRPRRSRVRWNFSLTVRPQYGTGVDSTHSYTDCLEIWEPQPRGTLRACPGLHMDWFPFFTIVRTAQNVLTKLNHRTYV
jgi:hypothetical protein